MKAQSAAAATSGVVRVPHMPSGADASSSAAASEAITDTRSVAGAWAGRAGAAAACPAALLNTTLEAPFSAVLKLALRCN